MKSVYSKHRGYHLRGDIDTPTVEVFGSALALLIIVFILTNLVISKDITAMLEHSVEDAKYKVSWQDGSEGFVVISYYDKIRIIETNEDVLKADICKQNSPFIRYVEKIYDNKDRQQLIFAITDKSVTTMAIARECLRVHYLNRAINIGWIIANKDLLSTVRLQDLPKHIKRSIRP